MSQRLRKSITQQESKQESKPANKTGEHLTSHDRTAIALAKGEFGLQESKQETLQALPAPARRTVFSPAAIIQEVPYVAPGPTIALNARISPDLMAKIKSFCVTTKREVGPERITLQEFITCALERELEQQLKRVDLGSSDR